MSSDSGHSELAQRSDRLTARFWGVGVAAVLLAILLWANDHGVFATLAGLFGAMVSWYGTVVRVSRCPACKARIQVTPGPNECPKCHEHLVLRPDHQVIPMPEDYVAAATYFKLRLEDLKSPGQWQVPWPGRCCVCGGPAVRTEDAAWSVKVRNTLFGAEGIRYRFPVSYCADHRGGFDTPLDGRTIGFRSRAYWRAFHELNAGKPDATADLVRTGFFGTPN